jgi:glutamate-5-semialdehyde dehydrogenase
MVLLKKGISPNSIWGLVEPSREEINYLMTQNRYIDVLIPRGGDALIEFVTKNSSIPLIKNDRGLCHIYVHADADQDMSLDIIDNAKTQRPGVCNSVESILIDINIASDFVPKIISRLKMKQVEIFACERVLKLIQNDKLVKSVTEFSYDTEYLDLKINLKIVDSLVEAIEHIDLHGSHHSESIITKNELVAKKFQSVVDAAVVYWNASTRFTDGLELGLGGEIGISTQKLHVRGPVGAAALTSCRWIIDGTGQVRL